MIIGVLRMRNKRHVLQGILRSLGELSVLGARGLGGFEVLWAKGLGLRV